MRQCSGCISCSSYYCDEMPDGSSPRKGGFISAHGSRLQSMEEGKLWQWEGDVTEPLTLCSQSGNRERMLALCSPLLFIQSGTPPLGVVLPTVRVVFPSHLAQSINCSKASPEVSLDPIKLIVNISYYTGGHSSPSDSLHPFPSATFTSWPRHGRY